MTQRNAKESSDQLDSKPRDVNAKALKVATGIGKDRSIKFGFRAFPLGNAKDLFNLHLDKPQLIR